MNAARWITAFSPILTVPPVMRRFVAFPFTSISPPAAITFPPTSSLMVRVPPVAMISPATVRLSTGASMVTVPPDAITSSGMGLLITGWSPLTKASERLDSGRYEQQAEDDDRQISHEGARSLFS
jgi:hypothetical protein